jgi:hypothetical protein
MKLTGIRLVFVSVLFAGWLGYLLFLVTTRPRTPSGARLVLSRPQILTSQIDIVADIDDPDGQVTVREVLWPEDAPLKPGDKIQLPFLADCHPPTSGPVEKSSQKDWSGPGLYLVPLKRLENEKDKYEVAPIPSSPGFHSSSPVLRIYPATKEALAQYQQIRKPVKE